MAAAKPLDDTKVMDVARPGKTKPISTSRPVITTHATLGQAPQVESTPDKVAEGVKGADVVAPSQTRHIIAPITIDVKPVTESDGEAEKIEITSIKNESDQTADKMTETEHESEPAAEPITEPEAPEQPNGPETASMGSDAAGIDALADSVASKKRTEKDLDEQQKREEAVNQLIASKKYHVPMAHDSTRSRKGNGAMIALLTLITIAAAVYALVDLGIVDLGFEVPYHILKK